MRPGFRRKVFSLLVIATFAISSALGCHSTSGSIFGKVTDTSGDPIRGVSIKAYRLGTLLPEGIAVTGADGRYAIEGLFPGDYHVSAEAEGYHGVYYPEVFYWDSATAVTVPMPVRHDGINFVLKKCGSMSGSVTDVAGNPIEGARIECNIFGFWGPSLYGLDRDHWYPDPFVVRTAMTDENGFYVVTDLTDSPADIRCYAEGYLEERYGAYVGIKPETETTGINFTLQPSTPMPTDTRVPAPYSPYTPVPTDIPVPTS